MQHGTPFPPSGLVSHNRARLPARSICASSSPLTSFSQHLAGGEKVRCHFIAPGPVRNKGEVIRWDDPGCCAGIQR